MSQNGRTFAKSLEKYEGQPISVLCMRYWYRGVLTEVGEDYIILSEARAVEQTGSASGSAPQREDPIPSDLTIKHMAIEIVCQPAWNWHGYEHLQGKKSKAKK